MVNFKKTRVTLSELAEMTNLSRPTIYKFIDLYNEGQGLLVRHDVYLMLHYLENNQKASKKDVYVYYESLFNKGDK